MQLDGAFWPAEPLRPPSREAIAGQSLLRTLQGRPAMVFNSDGGVPIGYLGAESEGGVKRLRSTTGGASGSGGSPGAGDSRMPMFGSGSVDPEALARAVEGAPGNPQAGGTERGGSGRGRQ